MPRGTLVEPLRSQGIGCGRLAPNADAVAPGLKAHRMRKHAGVVGRRVDDVVGKHPACRIQSREVANAFGNLMVRTGSIAADAEAADDLPPAAINGHAAAEKICPPVI